MKDQLKHDFINNTLRLEVLFKLIGEDLEKNRNLDQKQLQDAEKFLKEALDQIQQLQLNLQN
jgi:hypothetical protein